MARAEQPQAPRTVEDEHAPIRAPMMDSILSYVEQLTALHALLGVGVRQLRLVERKLHLGDVRDDDASIERRQLQREAAGSGAASSTRDPGATKRRNRRCSSRLTRPRTFFTAIASSSVDLPEPFSPLGSAERIIRVPDV